MVRGRLECTPIEGSTTRVGDSAARANLALIGKKCGGTETRLSSTPVADGKHASTCRSLWLSACIPHNISGMREALVGGCIPHNMSGIRDGDRSRQGGLDRYFVWFFSLLRFMNLSSHGESHLKNSHDVGHHFGECLVHKEQLSCVM